MAMITRVNVISSHGDGWTNRPLAYTVEATGWRPFCVFDMENVRALAMLADVEASDDFDRLHHLPPRHDGIGGGNCRDDVPRNLFYLTAEGGGGRKGPGQGQSNIQWTKQQRHISKLVLPHMAYAPLPI